MENEEIRSTIEQIKAQVKAKPENKDKTDDEIDQMILDAFFKAYTDGEMTKEDLLGLAEVMGYEASPEFLNDQAAADQIDPTQEGGEGAPAPEDGNGGAPTQEELEDVRTMDKGESPEEFKEKVEEVKEGNGEGGDPAPAPAPNPAEEGNGGNGDGNDEDEEDDEDAERKKASELWKMNLNK